MTNQGNEVSKGQSDDVGLDARTAAQLLHESTKRARRQFDDAPPFLLVIGAVIFLSGFAIAWWSVRGQNPYTGPSGTALAVMYGGIVAWIVAVSTVVQRANKGVRGPSTRGRKFRGAYLIVIVAYSVFQGALYHAGASHAIVYGIFPTSAPWLFAGTVLITMGVVREELRTLVLGTGLVAVGLASAFAGPKVSWLVSGIGLCAVLIAMAAYQFARTRASGGVRVH